MHVTNYRARAVSLLRLRNREFYLSRVITGEEPAAGYECTKAIFFPNDAPNLYLRRIIRAFTTRRNPGCAKVHLTESRPDYIFRRLLRPLRRDISRRLSHRA